MPEDLNVLVIQALDEFSQLAQVQELLEICLEQSENPSDKAWSRVELLLSISMPYLDLHLGELRLALEKIQKCLGAST